MKKPFWTAYDPMSYRCEGMEQLSLVRVTISYTSIVDADVEDIWKIVKLWCPSMWLHSIENSQISFQLLAGESGEQIGAVRAVYIGAACLVERLVAMDAEDHSQSWKCISDSHSINPFPGSFVDYINTISFKAMTNGKSQADWQGELWTDPEMSETMEDILREFYKHSLQFLEAQILWSKQPRLQAPAADDFPKKPATIRTLRDAFGDHLQ